MSLDLYGFISPDFESRPAGEVVLITREPGDYSGPGGTWVDGREDRRCLVGINIQPASLKTVQTLAGAGGALNPQDWRSIHLNDGTMVYPDDDGQMAYLFEFSDGRAVRQWRVRESDCRPDRNYCRAVVERYRGQK